jgi:uncharacterized protein (DUF433 family)
MEKISLGEIRMAVRNIIRENKIHEKSFKNTEKISLNELRDIIRKIMGKKKVEDTPPKIERFKIKYLEDGLTMWDLQNKFPWVLKADIEKAIIGIDGNSKKIIWYNGTWHNGIWENGTWENGTFAGGIWEDGDFRGGTFAGETWKRGWFYDGIFASGTFKNGSFRGGTFDGGTFDGGNWVLENLKIINDPENPIWKSGVWKSGQISTMRSGAIKEIFMNPNEYHAEIIAKERENYSNEYEVSGKKKIKIKRLENNLTMKTIKEKYPWILEAEIEDAVIGVTNNIIHWYSGTWHGGLWENGIWEKGYFTGRWKTGFFLNGEFVTGLWMDGKFYNGNFRNSTWIKGKFYGGEFESSRWNDGLWLLDNSKNIIPKWVGDSKWKRGVISYKDKNGKWRRIESFDNPKDFLGPIEVEKEEPKYTIENHEGHFTVYYKNEKGEEHERGFRSRKEAEDFAKKYLT